MSKSVRISSMRLQKNAAMNKGVTPIITLLSGPNGSDKTTTAFSILPV